MVYLKKDETAGPPISIRAPWMAAPTSPKFWDAPTRAARGWCPRRACRRTTAAGERRNRRTYERHRRQRGAALRHVLRESRRAGAVAVAAHGTIVDSIDLHLAKAARQQITAGDTAGCDSGGGGASRNATDFEAAPQRRAPPGVPGEEASCIGHSWRPAGEPARA